MKSSPARPGTAAAATAAADRAFSTPQPLVQNVARDDASGRITKRHLYSIARLSAPQQTRVLGRVRQN